MDAALLAAYDRPVPRYTSYPTAVQFTAAVGPHEHAKWLGQLAGGTVSLYVHVPFCQQLCWYCACHTMAVRRTGTLDAYASALMSELNLLAGQAPNVMIDSIQWGGGTPSQLGAHRLVEVGSRIAALFDRRCNGEVSMEIDPRYCTPELIDAMAALGVTRASLGVQDFDETVQAAINRPQTFDVTAAALASLRAAGIKRSNIDLVHGLPHQTLDTLGRTLDQAVALEPDRFAVFAYAHVPWMKAHQKLIDAAELPDTALRSAMAELVSRRLIDAGYQAIGLDHYARPDDRLAEAAATGRLRRTFQGYVASDTSWFIGIGASAISSLPAGYTQNAVDVADYMAAPGQGRFATARGIGLIPDDRLRGEIISQLMCTHEVDVGKICTRHGVSAGAFLDGIEDLPSLRRDGLVALNGQRLKVTERGRSLLRAVCAAFDGCYSAGQGRHSRL